MLIGTIERRPSLHKNIVWLQDGEDMNWPEIKAYLLDVDREERRALIEETEHTFKR